MTETRIAQTERIAQDEAGQWWYTLEEEALDGSLMPGRTRDGVPLYDGVYEPTIVGPYDSDAAAREALAVALTD